MPKLQNLKLAQKGLLIVILPVIMQLFLYVELKQQINDVQRQAEAQEYSRDVMVQVNAIILQASKLFEAYVNLWVIHNNELASRTDPLRKQVRGQLDELNALLATHPEDAASAAEIQRRGDDFLRELAAVRLTLGESDKPLTMWEALDMHQNFGETARGLNTALMKLGMDHSSRVRSAQTAEVNARNALLLFCDVAVGLTLFMAIGLAMFFVKGTVSSLEVLKNNAQRLGSNEELLPPIKGDDEIASVDQQFHDMARKLKEATAQLDDSYKRLQAVIDTVPMAIIICDETGSIESLNKAGSLLFGYELAEVHGSLVTQFFEQQRDPEATVKALNKWLEDSRERPLQLEGFSKEKEAVPIELSVLRFQSPKGPRFLLTVTDITERYKMEKMKRDFIAMVSHDIRSPLTSISGYLELIKQSTARDTDELSQTRIDAAQECADRLLAMVTKLLDLERLDSGVFNFDLREFAVEDAVHAAWEVTKSPAKNIVWRAPESDMRVFADRDSVEHVLQNFFSNAIKFSPEGGTIRCSVGQQDGMVKIAVIDQGNGIPDRYKNTIFDRFKQAPQGRARKDGTGLGLAICKSMVQALGGEIGVEDNPTGGSIFWFTVPAAAELAVTDPTDSLHSAACE